MDVKRCKVAAEKMDRTAFYRNIVRGVLLQDEVSTAMSGGMQDLSPAEKRSICESLQQAGIPAVYRNKADDARLLKVLKHISGRAFALR